MTVTAEVTPDVVVSRPLPKPLLSLPPFPPVALRLLDILSQEDSVVRQIVELIRLDTTFAAEIVRLANSPIFGFSRRIDSVGHAVALLGTERVKALTITVAVGAYGRKAFKHTSLRRCWQNTLATAFVAQEIAGACQINKDRAYTAGLLRDIGRLALLAAYPAEYSGLMTVACKNPINLLEVERTMFDVDHRKAGRLLAAEWDFPRELQDVIGEEDDLPIEAPLSLGALVRLAARGAEALGFSATLPVNPWFFSQVAAKLPQTAQSSFPSEEQLRRKIQEKVEAFAG
jgi:HD-like signal output (HDOD) protein